MDKWDELKEYIENEIYDCYEKAEKAKTEEDKEKWRCCAITAQYILDYMEFLEK